MSMENKEDKYLKEIFSYFKWITLFNINGIDYGGTVKIIENGRILRFNDLYNIKDKRILELGPLEAAYTLLLNRLGAKEVISIEGRTENYVKCSIIKNLFNLDNCHFICKDVKELDFISLGKFDVCLASGILYHLDDPYIILKNLSEVTDRLFIWTHIANDEFPKHPTGLVVSYRNYKGKEYSEGTINDVLSGMQSKSIWLFKEDFIKMLKDVGYNKYKILEEGYYYDEKAWGNSHLGWILVYAFKEKKQNG